MRVCRFTAGGFVIHGLDLPGSSCRVSAWFDDDGLLVDAERITRNNKTLPVEPNSKLWLQIAKRGKHYTKKG